MKVCIVCGSAAVEQFLDLGSTALANSFLTREDLCKPEPQYPLRVGACHSCGHVQLMETVPPAEMFTDYLYISSASDTLKAHLYDLSDVVVKRHRLGENDLVIDIGCNDGTLLGGFQRHGVRVLGVDPAENLAEMAKNSGVERYVGFFDSQTSKEIVTRWGQASAITATNTFPHIPDLPDFVDGLKTALAPGGVVVLELHYLPDLIEQGAFDTIYHEHVSYWALQPMMTLFQSLGMEVTNAERLPVHHGQLRAFVQRTGEGEVQPAVAEVLAEEKASGIGEFKTFQEFAKKTLSIKSDLSQTLSGLNGRGKLVVGYGAPAKTSTLLGFLKIDADTIPYIADRSLLKQGRYTPGTHILIVPPERLLEDQPDYVLLLAWNFVDEVLEQQSEYRRRGGKFILPVPQVTVV